MKHHPARRIAFALSLCAVVSVTGCAPVSPSRAAALPALTATPAQTSAQPVPVPTPAPTPAPLRVISAEAVADPSLAASDVVDPYAELNPYVVELYHPDRTLYNALYRAVLAREPSVDISGYDLPPADKADAAGCLYGERNYRFFYLKNLKVSKDGKKVTFEYTGKPDEIARNTEEFLARLSHLVYNVLPRDDSDIHKVVSLYDYLCRNADYAETMGEESTQTPYSILMKGQGICWGFANLTEYALRRAGVPVEYVSNEAHAWDIVKLNGNWYHTDVTWGAGAYHAPDNSINTLFMDDAKRHEGLASQGHDGQPAILGVPCSHPKLPPACTDRSLSAYNGIGSSYALDTDGGKVYFAGQGGGICRMNLDCTGRETLAESVEPGLMAYFNGTLYFTDTGDSLLYQLKPGQAPKRVEGVSGPVLYLRLSGTALTYSDDGAGRNPQTLELLPLPLPRDVSDASALPGAAVPRSRSFAFHIRFSEPIDKALNLNECVYLADASGKTIPLHFSLSADGTELTVRPKDCVADAGVLSFYITGLAAASGTRLDGCRRMDVKLQSE